MSHLLSKLKEHLPNDEVHDVAAVMTYEAADVLKTAIYLQKQKDTSAYRAELRKAMADLITQYRILAEMMGWTMYALQVEGEAAFFTKMEQYFGGKQR